MTISVMDLSPKECRIQFCFSYLSVLVSLAQSRIPWTLFRILYVCSVHFISRAR